MFQECAEGRRVDLAQAMSQDGHFLPGSFAVGDANPFIGAINFQSGSFVQRTNAEVWDEIFFTKGIAGNPKDEPHQPFHAGMGVEEPPLCFDGRGDLDDGWLLPVRVGKITKTAD